uniref:Uncharacterized protein n=1 Tax=Nelumbo nucifera TaxID=4432 RepID=A0A822YA48_NELNU|nr:TPA_asm: hypothetical protein HUJ06_029333 [Nelumbo nucifera]
MRGKELLERVQFEDEKLPLYGLRGVAKTSPTYSKVAASTTRILGNTRERSLSRPLVIFLRSGGNSCNRRYMGNVPLEYLGGIKWPERYKSSDRCKSVSMRLDDLSDAWAT